MSEELVCFAYLITTLDFYLHRVVRLCHVYVCTYLFGACRLCLFKSGWQDVNCPSGIVVKL